jgi:outer membrane protein assembly factor BamB
MSMLLSALTILALLTNVAFADAGAAAIVVRPTHGPPGQPVLVRGDGFDANELVDIGIDGSPLANATTDDAGRFHERIAIPQTTLPGSHVITAVGESSGRSASAAFTVQTNWPQAHFDASKTGFNPYENVLTPSTLDGLEVDWTVSIDTCDFSFNSPSVANGVLYAVSCSGLLDAIDALNGDVLWSVATGESESETTPAVAGGRVYVALQSGDVVAFAAQSGEMLWRITTGSFELTPPTVADGKIFVGSEHGVLAIDTYDGHVVWWQGTDSSFDAPAVSGRKVFAAVSNVHPYVEARDARTGQRIWYTPLPNNGYTLGSGVAVFDGLAYVGGGNDRVYALDAATGEIVWETLLDGNVNTTPVVAEGIVYAASKNLAAMDARTGELLWEGGTGLSYQSPPTAAGGVVYVGQSNLPASIIAKDAATGEQLWRSPPSQNQIWSMPIVVDGRLFLQDWYGNIFCYALL